MASWLFWWGLRKRSVSTTVRVRNKFFIKLDLKVIQSMKRGFSGIQTYSLSGIEAAFFLVFLEMRL